MAAGPAERVRLALQRWLETTHLTQREFAQQLGRSQPWLDKVLQGVNHVRLEDLDDLATALRTTASELIRTEDDRLYLELTPSEVRVIERLRHRGPKALEAIELLMRNDRVEKVLSATGDRARKRPK